jgi:hypothetical protein
VIDRCGITVAIDDADGIESNTLMSGLMIAEPMKRGSSNVLKFYWSYGITWNSVTI